MKIVFTVCNRTQLSNALCLGESLRTSGSNRQFILGWVDPAPIPELPDWIEAIRVESIEIADWQEMTARYYDFELVSACKPFFARYILEKFTECHELLYLSPTILVLGSLDTVISDTSFFQLTPHRLSPNDSKSELADRHLLNIGMYHSGSWVLHPDGVQEHKLLNWWCDRCLNRAHFDLCSGMCLDQLWLNYFPIYLEGVDTIRQAGWHHGLHRISGTQLTTQDSRHFVDGQPLLTLDMAGLEGYHPVWSDFSSLVKGDKKWEDIRKNYRQSLTFNSKKISDAELPYGKPSEIKSNRLHRKLGVRFLNQLIQKIETYNLTYN